MTVIDLAAERAKRRPIEQTSISAKGCLVCPDPTGVRCCEYGRDR